MEIVAEIGSNHNGDLSTAHQLIHAAAEAGANTVKCQHYPDKRYGPHPMPQSWLFTLQETAKQAGVGFLCSVFDHRTLDEYAATGATRVKIASAELTQHDLIAEAAQRFDTVIFGTGMSTRDEVRSASFAAFRGDDDYPTMIFLHCISAYPTPPNQLNLSAMLELLEDGEAGLSDHTMDPIMAPIAATAMGAVMIEKHFTLDRDQEGPDHAYALDPVDFAYMVEAVRTTEAMLGDGNKRVMPCEDLAGEWRRQPAAA